MKMVLSKDQWEEIGRDMGWLRLSQSDATEDNDKNISRKRIVRVDFSDGDHLETWIKGTVQEILDYYMPYIDKDGNPCGPDQDYSDADPQAVRRVVSVKFLD